MVRNIAPYMADSKENLAPEEGKEQKQATRHRMGRESFGSLRTGLPILPI
jgi:hypothetical protein